MAEKIRAQPSTMLTAVPPNASEHKTRNSSGLSPFRPPAFIVGMGRSGTTLLAAILNRHPQICVLPETEFLYQLANYPGGDSAFKNGWPASLYKLVDRMHPTADWNRPAHLVYNRLGGKPSSGKDVFLALGEIVSERHGKPLWIEKTPNHALCLPFIRQLFPQAPIIHIIRDGRDVADSLTRVPRFGHPSYLFNLWNWSKTVQAVRKFRDSDTNILSVNYEDLVSDPPGVVNGICRFLGVEYIPNMLTPNGSEAHLVELGTKHKDEVTRPIDSSKVTRWRLSLPPSMQRAADMVARSELIVWGYERATRPALPAERLWVSESLLVARHCDRDRALYDFLLQVVACGSRPLSLEKIASIKDSLQGALPDLWITDELPLPASAPGVSGLRTLALLSYKLMKLRFSGCRLVWIFKPDPFQSRKWRLRRLTERLMIRMSTLIVWSGDDITLPNEWAEFGVPMGKCFDRNDPDLALRLLAALEMVPASHVLLPSISGCAAAGKSNAGCRRA